MNLRVPVYPLPVEALTMVAVHPVLGMEKENPLEVFLKVWRFDAI